MAATAANVGEANSRRASSECSDRNSTQGGGCARNKDDDRDKEKKDKNKQDKCDTERSKRSTPPACNPDNEDSRDGSGSTSRSAHASGSIGD
ncbi:MAG: hypothetical protein M3R54_07545 [Chloroflexota bacterium]|nr:hypothetical protein [Chloroflexota bacterium]